MNDDRHLPEENAPVRRPRRALVASALALAAVGILWVCSYRNPVTSGLQTRRGEFGVSLTPGAIELYRDALSRRSKQPTLHEIVPGFGYIWERPVWAVIVPFWLVALVPAGTLLLALGLSVWARLRANQPAYEPLDGDELFRRLTM